MKWFSNAAPSCEKPLRAILGTGGHNWALQHDTLPTIDIPELNKFL
jgi:hypothetical protein